MKDFKDYVCTLDQAKKLKELGIEESLFVWVCNDIEKGNEYIIDKGSANYINLPNFKNTTILPAFTSQDLGELINQETKGSTCSIRQTLDIDKDNTVTFTVDSYAHDVTWVECIKAENEAQARAEFLIYLLKKIRKKR